jgi:hypothetical protein
MSIVAHNLIELQNIVLWQQLNKQLIDFKAVNKLQLYQYQLYIKELCLKQSLFSIIKQSNITEEISMAILTNFSTFGFITINSKSWQNCLKLFLESYTPFLFDLDEALAETFVVLKNYNDTYKLIGKNDNDPDDQQYYEAIGTYLNKKGEMHWDFPDIVLQINELKGNVMLDIAQMADQKYSISLTPESLVFTINDPGIIDKANSIYDEKFCKPAQGIIQPLNVDLLALWGLLDVFSQVPDLSGHIEKFTKHEIASLGAESQAGKNFLKSLEQRKSPSVDRSMIRICNTSAFGFLQNPLPPV